MNDIDHLVGGDLTLLDTGVISVVSGAEAGKQRVLRRLLTNPGEYVWHPSYGAGLPRRIGEAMDASEIEAKVLSQMLLEEAVSQSPSPTVDVTELTGGMFFVSIAYTDNESGQPVVLQFSPSE